MLRTSRALSGVIDADENLTEGKIYERKDFAYSDK